MTSGGQSDCAGDGLSLKGVVVAPHTNDVAGCGGTQQTKPSFKVHTTWRLFVFLSELLSWFCSHCYEYWLQFLTHFV